MNSPAKLITKLDPNEVFVFGSNLAGRHGKGAAKQALKWGAIYGIGHGLLGQTWALPTKDEKLRPLPLYRIEFHVMAFMKFATRNSHLRFLVTEVGCGLAGYKPEEIAKLFLKHKIPSNVVLPESFLRAR